jgi:Histidine kinase-like ATPase domain
VPSAWWETPAVTTRPLRPIAEEARTARQFVREMLTCWGLGHLSDDAELIAAELVGNAVRHGLRPAWHMGGHHSPGHHSPGHTRSTGPQVIPFGADRELPVLRLCLLRRAGEVMVAVTDPSDDAPAPKSPSSDGESGRGLQIVGALSNVWGWSPIEGRGKAVWAVLKFAE